MEIHIFTFGNDFSQYERDPVTGLEHARQRTVKFAEHKTPILFEVRDLLVHLSAALASGSEWTAACHNLSVVLRSIADTYYPITGSLTDDDAELFDDQPPEDEECDVGPVDSPADQPKVQPFVRSDFEVPALARHEDYALSAELIWERIDRGDRLYAPAEHVLRLDFPDRARESHGVSGLLISHTEILHWLHASHVREEFRKLPYEAKYRILAGEMVEALNRHDGEWEAFCASLRAAPAEPLSAGEHLSILAALEAISEEA